MGQKRRCRDRAVLGMLAKKHPGRGPGKSNREVHSISRLCDGIQSTAREGGKWPLKLGLGNLVFNEGVSSSSRNALGY